MMNRLRRLLDFIFPSSCAFCRSPVDGSDIPFFCSTCWADFAPILGPLCRSCGRPFESDEALTHSPEHRCYECRINPPGFDMALSIGYFEGPLREAIHQFKYRPCRALGRPLGDWMASQIRMVNEVDLIIPVPLHRSRLRQRGFNQALLLASEINRFCHAPLSFDNLYRARPTRPQVELTGNERLKNVAGAFKVHRPEELQGKRIILIDDVFTTGATLRECASVLRKAGTIEVTALTLARAV
jgi:ComF family protein